jgi:hypothetical protein
MKLRSNCLLVVAFAIAALVAIPAVASPLVNLSLLGRVTGSGADFSSSVIANPGQSIDIQLWVDMAPIGTSNLQGTTTRTINSLTLIQLQGDGVQSLKFNIAKLLNKPETTLAGAFAGGLTFNSDPSTTLTNDSWGAITGANGGTISGTDLTAVRPGHAAGLFSAIDPEVVGTTTFNFTSGSGWLSVQWYSSASAAFKINGTTNVIATNTTETGADPYVGYTPLGINIVPEPSTLALAASGLLGLIACASRKRK